MSTIGESQATRGPSVRARAIAERSFEPGSDEAAQLAPFANPEVASSISQIIDQGLAEPGARDVTAAHRKGERLVSWNGCSYLLPTIVHCENPAHPLANKEFLFPFSSVVNVPQRQLTETLGPSLVVTAITRDPELVQRLVSSPNVDRLNVGPVPTNQVSWDQPHEGNLFEHLYARRAFQRAVSF